MLLRLVRFVNLLLAGASAGVVLSHVLERPAKLAMPARDYLRVQQNLYQQYGRAGAIVEGGGLFSGLLCLWLSRRRPAAFALTAVGTACGAVMTGVWALFLDPINKRMSAWTEETMPENWAVLRDRWEILHATRAVLAGVAFSAQVSAAMAETPVAARPAPAIAVYPPVPEEDLALAQP